MPRFGPHPDRRPVLIAGGSSGIGAATGVMLAAAGYPVALGARRLERCQEYVDQIVDAGGEAVAVSLDVTDPASVDDCVLKAEAALGEIEVVVSGAGDMSPGRTYEVSTDEFAAQVNIHLTGAQRLYRRIVPEMMARLRGDFVFISSDIAADTRPHMGSYAAAKAGLEAFAHTAQMEVEGSGVRVSLVRPGQTLTGMGMNVDPETTTAMLTDWGPFGFARHGNFMKPEHLATAITAVVGMPRGAHMRLVEVEAEAPLPRTPRSATDTGETR
ncbi:MAG: SDR family oxidoreductase [Williamsia herbipolensis]|uniref:SDR family oxidoreductase n=1 Tax=uncultured Williamsia sp. TaxID=259311 RepID=UPI0019F7DE7B|nr:SDR family oxidoreductase [uncultured Williamsia sp.]MBE7159787.1 SDR family oxidoreductase [Williamsia herbipolensis]